MIDNLVSVSYCENWYKEIQQEVLSNFDWKVKEGLKEKLWIIFKQKLKLISDIENEVISQEKYLESLKK